MENNVKRNLLITAALLTSIGAFSQIANVQIPNEAFDKFKGMESVIFKKMPKTIDVAVEPSNEADNNIDLATDIDVEKYDYNEVDVSPNTVTKKIVQPKKTKSLKSKTTKKVAVKTSTKQNRNISKTVAVKTPKKAIDLSNDTKVAVNKPKKQKSLSNKTVNKVLASKKSVKQVKKQTTGGAVNVNSKNNLIASVTPAKNDYVVPKKRNQAKINEADFENNAIYLETDTDFSDRIIENNSGSQMFLANNGYENNLLANSTPTENVSTSSISEKSESVDTNENNSSANSNSDLTAGTIATNEEVNLTNSNNSDLVAGENNLNIADAETSAGNISLNANDTVDLTTEKVAENSENILSADESTNGAENVADAETSAGTFNLNTNDRINLTKTDDIENSLAKTDSINEVENISKSNTSTGTINLNSDETQNYENSSIDNVTAKSVNKGKRKVYNDLLSLKQDVKEQSVKISENNINDGNISVNNTVNDLTKDSNSAEKIALNSVNAEGLEKVGTINKLQNGVSNLQDNIASESVVNTNLVVNLDSENFKDKISQVGPIYISGERFNSFIKTEQEKISDKYGYVTGSKLALNNLQEENNETDFSNPVKECFDALQSDSLKNIVISQNPESSIIIKNRIESAGDNKFVFNSSIPSENSKVVLLKPHTTFNNLGLLEFQNASSLAEDESIAKQQSLLMAYSFANSFDYTNAAGIELDSNPTYPRNVSLSSMSINPSIKYGIKKNKNLTRKANKNNMGRQSGFRLALAKFSKSKPLSNEPILIPGRIIIRPENVK